MATPPKTTIESVIPDGPDKIPDVISMPLPQEAQAPAYGKAATERNYRNPSKCSSLDKDLIPRRHEHTPANWCVCTVCGCGGSDKHPNWPGWDTHPRGTCYESDLYDCYSESERVADAIAAREPERLARARERAVLAGKK
jgi:hypothetical protein